MIDKKLLKAFILEVIEEREGNKKPERAKPKPVEAESDEEYSYEDMMNDIKSAVAMYEGGATEGRNIARQFCVDNYGIDKFKDLAEGDYKEAAEGVKENLSE